MQRRILYSHNNNNNIANNNENNKYDSRRFVSIPFFGNISFTIKRILSDFNLKTTFRVDSKLDNMIKLGKDPLDIFEQSNVVYKITCKQCNKIYIGQTGRLLRTRRNEHRNNIKLSEKYHKVVSKHILEFDHDFNWDNLLILHKENNYFKRCLAKIFYIKKEGNNFLIAITGLKNYIPSYNVILEELINSKCK